MNRLNRLHAEQQEVCSSIWGQQLRRCGHQTKKGKVSTGCIPGATPSLFQHLGPAAEKAQSPNRKGESQHWVHTRSDIRGPRQPIIDTRSLDILSVGKTWSGNETQGTQVE